MDSFEHAKMNAKPDCPVCDGKGSYMYDHNHGTVCYSCCKHDLGFWPLTPAHYGWSDGNRWCCRAGCGFALPFNPEELEPPAGDNPASSV